MRKAPRKHDLAWGFLVMLRGLREEGGFPKPFPDFPGPPADGRRASAGASSARLSRSGRRGRGSGGSCIPCRMTCVPCRNSCVPCRIGLRPAQERPVPRRARGSALQKSTKWQLWQKAGALFSCHRLRKACAFRLFSTAITPPSVSTLPKFSSFGKGFPQQGT